MHPPCSPWHANSGFVGVPCLTLELTGVGGTALSQGRGPGTPAPLHRGETLIFHPHPHLPSSQAPTICIKESFVLKKPMGGRWEANVNQHVYYSSLRTICYPGPQTGILEQAGLPWGGSIEAETGRARRVKKEIMGVGRRGST